MVAQRIEKYLMDNTVIHWMGTYPLPRELYLPLKQLSPDLLKGLKKIYEDSSEIPGLNSVWHHPDYNKRQKGLMQEF